MTAECGGKLKWKNATFKNYIGQDEKWSHYIDGKKKNTWRIYTVK